MNKPEMRVIKLQLTREESTIKALERQYRNALRDIDDRIRILQSDELTQSRVYQIQYQRALRGQVAGILDKLHGDQYATIQQYLHDSYQDGFIGTMYSLHGQGIPLIVPLDQDAAVKAIMTDSKINEGLYASLGVDTKMLKKAISTEISRGIASNLPFADIARNIRNRTRAPLGRAKTIVRTESHRIQQAAADDARNAAKERGCEVVKQWDGTLDGATRPTHRRLDGQIRETNEPFEMDGKMAMYPGDFGKPEEDCNCRCVALTRAKWALDEEELKVLKDRAKTFGLMEEDSKAYGHAKAVEFARFREKYLKAAAEIPRNKPEKAPPRTPEPLINQGESGIMEEDGTASAGVLDGFNRKARMVEPSEDIKEVNPNYATGLYKWTHNCQRCVPTYELRRRGYAVTAKPQPYSDVNKDLLARQPWLAWDSPQIIGYKTRADIERTMAAMEDGTRVQIKIVWKNGEGHTFVAEKHGDKIAFIDPQTGNMDCSNYFDNMKNSWDNLFWVISGKSPTDRILDCCE